MAQEIERKFLVKGEAWRSLADPVPYRQGYLCRAKERTVRVRTEGERAVLTIKGQNVGARRPEFEFEIPLAEANALLDDLCERPLIEKTRRKIPFQGLVWEVDDFAGDNAGLVVAEVELDDEGQDVPLPEWIGEEVTGDPKYYNANLVAHPYRDW